MKRQLAVLATVSLLALAAAAPALALETVAPAAAATDAGAIQAPPLQYRERTLANGLRVLSIQDRSSPTVSTQMWYNVGSKDDPQGRSGFAHLFEHVMSRQTRNIPRGYINQLVEDVGGARNASTSSDWTNYYEVVPSQYLETMLWTHAERMDRLVVDESVFNAERDIVKEELRQRVLAEPYGRLQRYVIPENSFRVSPYHRSGIGSIEQLNAATIDDARAFHDTFYRPDTATLIISGDFDQAQLDAWVDHYFAGIQLPLQEGRVRPVPRFVAAEPERTGPRTVEAYAPNVPLPAIAWSYPAPRRADADSVALEVLSAVLDRGDSSRFNAALIRPGVASSAFMYESMNEDDGFLAPYVVAAGGRTPQEVETALQGVMDDVRDNPVSEAELAEAKTQLITSALQQRQTAQGRANALGSAVMEANDPAFADRRLAMIGAVTVADVQRVARRWFDDGKRVSIRYQDESARPAGAADQPAPSVETYGLTLPPSTRPIIETAPEGERMAPPAPQAARTPRAPEIAERTLANGLRVIAARTSDIPLVSAQLFVRGGEAAESSPGSAVNELSALMMSRAVGGMDAQETAARVESLGATLGSFGGTDRQTLVLNAPQANADAAGALMAAAALSPTFAADELAVLKREQADARRVALRNPGVIAGDVSSRLVYGATPYGSGLPGERGLTAVTNDEVRAFHQTLWRPDNATLVIAGAMSPDEAFAYAERLFGGWAQPSTPAPTLADLDGPPRPPRVVVIDMPQAGQAAVYATIRTGPRADPNFYPLSVANAVLGGGSNGRLFQEVRAKRGLSYGAYSGLSSAREDGRLQASAQTRNDAVAQTVGVIMDEIDRLGREAPDAGAVQRRITFLQGNYGRQIETSAGIAATLAQLAALGLPTEEVTRYPTQIGAVTLEDVARVAGERITSANATVVIVGDGRQFLDALRTRYPQVEVVPFAEIDFDDPDLGLDR